MNKKINIAILASHGSGINAFHAYLNNLPGMRCVKGIHNLKELEDSIPAHPEELCSILLDSIAYVENGVLDYILNHSKNDSTLIVLSRDPVERLISVVNTHILRWAWSSCGFFRNDVKVDFFRHYGDLNAFVMHILDAPTMNTWRMLNKFTKIWEGRSIHYDMADIAPDQIKTSLELIIPIVGRDALKNFSPPSRPVFTRENDFIRFIKYLEIHYNYDIFYLKPCPISFLDDYGYSKSDICACFEKNECMFTCGNFDDKIAFILTQKNKLSWHEEAIKENMNKLIQYCKDMSRRDKYAKNMASHLYLNYNKLVDFAKSDRTFYDKLKLYLSGHITSFPEHIIKKWEKAIQLAAILDK